MADRRDARRPLPGGDERKAEHGGTVKRAKSALINEDL